MQTDFLAQGGARGSAPAVGRGAQLEHKYRHTFMWTFLQKQYFKV